MSEPRRDELSAALSTRRELGPEYDEAVADHLAEKLHEEITRQVETRLSQERNALPQRLTSSQKVAITIVALVTGFLTTGAVVSADTAWLGAVIWTAVALIGISVNVGRR